MVEKLFGDKQKEGFLKLSDSCKTACTSGLDSLEMTHTARQASALAKKIAAQIYKECQQHASPHILRILSSHLDTQKALFCLDAMRKKMAMPILIIDMRPFRLHSEKSIAIDMHR